MTVDANGLAKAVKAGSATITATDVDSSVKATKTLKVSYHKIVPDIWANGAIVGIDKTHGALVPATVKGGVEPVSKVEARTADNVVLVDLDGHTNYQTVTLVYAGQSYTLAKVSNAYQTTNEALVKLLHSQWATGQARPIDIIGNK
ncbi:hypothetical protein [Vibrio phage vB_VpaS_CHI]|nr:hypothetical protein [Vibrio phage vB_VpaS_ALK]USL90126.1 hypothetical protein [Vibrio phage vB_VpaS_CHI]